MVLYSMKGKLILHALQYCTDNIFNYDAVPTQKYVHPVRGGKTGRADRDVIILY